eukprot:scaffold79_cov259-Pinguiococcus_pyrenoidosus.AAC.37
METRWASYSVTFQMASVSGRPLAERRRHSVVLCLSPRPFQNVTNQGSRRNSWTNQGETLGFLTSSEEYTACSQQRCKGNSWTARTLTSIQITQGPRALGSRDLGISGSRDLRISGSRHAAIGDPSVVLPSLGSSGLQLSF